jgi:hypothetical protein
MATTTFGYFFLPAPEEPQTKESGGIATWNAALEATDAIIHGVYEAHTAGDTLTEAESQSHHSNKGASGTVMLTLPSDATAGCIFHYDVMAAYEFRILPVGGAVYINGAKQSDDKYITANAVNESVTLVSVGDNDWFAKNAEGTWTVQA